MMRLVHLAAIAILIGSAAYAYSIKYETLYFSEEIVRLRAKLNRERDAIAVAKAEWVLMTRPDRLQKMVDQHLELRPLTVNQLARFSDLPVRPAPSDEIGRKLELLGMETGSTTPKDRKRPSDARTPAAAPTTSSRPAATAAR